MSGGNYSTNRESETAQRASEIEEPASHFVFIGEHEDSIDEAHFKVWRYPDGRWVNLTSGRHARSGTLSFADGHVESWRWRWSKQFRGNERRTRRTWRTCAGCRSTSCR